VGVALPWITGLCTYAIPRSIFLKPVPRRCPIAVLPNPQVLCVYIFYLVFSLAMYTRGHEDDFREYAIDIIAFDYRVAQNVVSYRTLSISSLNIDQFSEFFHQ